MIDEDELIRCRRLDWMSTTAAAASRMTCQATIFQRNRKRCCTIGIRKKKTTTTFDE